MLLQWFNKNQWLKTKRIHTEYGKKPERKIRKKREERKNLEEKAAKQRAERKEQMDKLTEEGEAESFTISATGMDMKSVTQNLIAAVSGTPVPTGVSFDIKA